MLPNDLSPEAVMIIIIPAEKRHLPGILEIENMSFSEPWSEKSFATEFDADSFFAVALEDKILLGFVILRALGDEGEIFKIAVLPDKRGQGTGDALLKAALYDSADRGIRRVYLEVRANNEPAIRLYEKHGFITAGRRKHYYSHPVEDAVLMERKL